MSRNIYKSVLVISDLHCPYGHKDTLRFLAAAKLKYAPDKIISVGDEIDWHSISFHDSDPNLKSPGDELAAAVKQMKKLYSLFPNVTVLESNHGSLVLRKAVSNGLPREVFKSYNEVLEAPSSWKWVHDLIIETPLGPVYFCHGKSGTPGRLASQYGMSCVQGHFHEKAQVSWISTPERLMFDMHVGCLVDNSSLALAYNKTNVRRPIISIGVIINGIAQIVPMVLNESGRWIGKL